MRYFPDTQSFTASATDLANHARCGHLTQRMRERTIAIAEGREEPVAATGLSIDKGRAFEAEWVAERRREAEAAGERFLDVGAAAGNDRAAQRELLAQAMREGVELIAQAPLKAGSVTGYADLLERVADGAEATGSLDTRHRYEPVEIKYARSVRPEHVLQASAYADALEALQGALPQHLHIVCGDRTRHALRTSDYVEYFRAARARFGEALGADLQAELELVPDPVAHCATCDFAPVCGTRRRDVDHLSLVARIRTDQRAKLAAVGIHTLTDLAQTSLERVPGIGRATLPQLRAQAALQLAARSRELPGVEYRQPAPEGPSGHGFALLPEPDAADIFFDFEGYPYHDAGALEYLWGWTSLDAAGVLRFDYLWADDPAAEGRAFTQFLDEVHARRERSPGMHVFHYAPYEITALRRLAKEHPREMDRLDELLRAGVFVDLYAVVRQAMLVGTESYSIKKLEPLYGISRAGDDLADGGASIEVYEQWLVEGDPAVRDTIIDYNRVDCDSTLALRDWLLEHRERARAAGVEWPSAANAADDEAGELTLDEPAEPHERDVLVTRLEAIAEDEARPEEVRLVARLLGAMPGWDRRIKREFFGDLHARALERDDDDLLVEPTAIAGLELIDEEPVGRAGTFLRRYRFPEQVTLVKEKQTALDPYTVCSVGKVEHVDFDENIIGIRTTAGMQERCDAHALRTGRAPGARPTAVIGWTDINAGPLQDAAARVADDFLAALEAGRDPFAPQEPGAAALSMLARRPTRLTHGSGTGALSAPPDPDELAELVRRLDGSHLIVQGPPGTGKTWTSARLITSLVESGLRVGISSNSHAAIINVLRGLDDYRGERAADGRPVTLRATYPLRSTIGEKAPGDLGFGTEWITRAKGSATAVDQVARGEAQVLAGTAWAFAKDSPVDVVLVDEAGQISLLHATAIASGTRNVVLVGDPQQLPQPASVQHPHGCGASVLEHLFEGEAVLPPERAVLLPISRRMHPDVCDFVSTTYYEGELQSHPDTAGQRIDASGEARLPSTGTHLLAVEHAGRRSSSPEEATAIAELVRQLLASGRVVAKPGQPERAIEAKDIIVVAPYNAQRRLLEDALGPDIAVGTVDRFQGQEAPVAIVSLTASSRDELPRGLEFLLDPHRLNVAISRARALAIVVASPALLATSANSLEEMRLLNDLARLASRA